MELYLARDFGEFKSKGIVWCRFDDPFATNHLLASKLKFGSTVASVQLWKDTESEAPAPSGNRLLQSLAFTKPVAHPKLVARDISDKSAADDDEEADEDRMATAIGVALVARSFKLIVGSRAVEIDAREKCRPA